MPTIPQKAAGCLMEPPVSVPRENIIRSAATAAADPPLDPPGTLFSLHGFFVFVKYEVSPEDPIAKLSRFSLPTSIAPLSLSF